MNSPLSSPSSQPLLYRGLIVLGWFCLAKAILDLAVTLIEFPMNSLSVRMLSLRSSRGEWNYVAILGLRVLTALLLGAAAIGLIRVRNWSRIVLQIWAVVLMALIVCQSAFFASIQLDAIHRVRSTASTMRPSDASIIATHALSALESLLIPALVLWFITRPEVRNLWSSRKRGGFEVLPLGPAGSSADDRG